YRGLRGIIDLRTGEDGFLPNSEDWEYASQLDADFDRLDFRGLLDRYFDLSPEIPPTLRRRQIAHILTAPERARKWLDALGPGAAAVRRPDFRGGGGGGRDRARLRPGSDPGRGPSRAPGRRTAFPGRAQPVQPGPRAPRPGLGGRLPAPGLDGRLRPMGVRPG